MPTKALDLDAELDHLYQVPLDDFVTERNRIASELGDEDRAADALQVHALAKPPISAWAVNQLYWKSRPEFDALMKAGQALRAAQVAAMRAPGTRTARSNHMHEATAKRDRALSSALQRALGLLQDGGHPASPAMRLRIATNLEALAAYGGVPPEMHAGRLNTDLDPPGFDVLAQAVHGGAAPRARQRPAHEAPRKGKVVSFEAITAARRAVAAAEHEAAARRAEFDEATEAVERARADVKNFEAETARLKKELEGAERDLQLARRRVPESEREAKEAGTRVEDARAEVEKARRELEELKKR